MIRGKGNRTLPTLLALALVLSLAVFTGCGKKPAIETNPADTGGQGTGEQVPAPPTPEPETPEVSTPDYANLDPADYGVEDVFFAFDQYDLDDEAMAILSRDARIIKEAGTVIRVSGHCDERGTIEYNLALGEKRANAVRDYLISLGVPSRNLRVTSYGESKPFANGHDEAAWALNRRAHFERP